MSPDAWQKLSATLDSLLDLPRAEQRQALDTLHKSDPEFCREVEALLGEQDTDQCFETPPEDLIDSLPTFDEDPHFDDGKAGRYEIQNEIARGGMGVDLPRHRHRSRPRRRGEGAAAAAKVRSRPRPPAASSDEARITGQLQHPGIPPVHDLGTLPDGRPFLAMKLIKGRTLAELLQRRGDRAAAGSSASSSRSARRSAYAHATASSTAT